MGHAKEVLQVEKTQTLKKLTSSKEFRPQRRNPRRFKNKRKWTETTLVASSSFADFLFINYGYFSQNVSYGMAGHSSFFPTTFLLETAFLFASFWWIMIRSASPAFDIHKLVSYTSYIFFKVCHICLECPQFALILLILRVSKSCGVPQRTDHLHFIQTRKYKICGSWNIPGRHLT